MKIVYHSANPLLHPPMFTIFNFLLDLLAKNDPFVLSLEKEEMGYWKEYLDVRKTEDWCISFFPYRDKSVKTAIVEIKARNNRTFLKNLALLASDVLIEELSELKAWHDFTPHIILPIPASSFKKGFNQSFEISRFLFENGICPNGLLLNKELEKKRRTSAQHELSREMRLRNLKYAMNIKHPEKFNGMDVLVVDDVTTTGATFEEARRALKEAGARKVLCVALAH